MNYDGTMARVPDLIDFCRIHAMKMISVEQLIRCRLENDRLYDRNLMPAVQVVPYSTAG
jgi:3,4-dihydroxy 2-butanone 4-phosphate synthase/GTP cyclohydrolase II